MTDHTVVGMNVQPAVVMTATPADLAAIVEIVHSDQCATVTVRLVHLVKVEPVNRLVCVLATLPTVRAQVATVIVQLGQLATEIVRSVRPAMAIVRLVRRVMGTVRSVRPAMATVQRDHRVTATVRSVQLATEIVRSVRPVTVTVQPETSATTGVLVMIADRVMTAVRAPVAVLSALVAPARAVLVRIVQPGSSALIANAIRTAPRAQ